MAVLHVYSSRTDYDSPKDRSFQMDHPLMFKYHDQHISPRIWHKCVMLQIIMTHLTSYGNVCIDKNVYLIAFVLYHLTLKTDQTPNTQSNIVSYIYRTSVGLIIDLPHSDSMLCSPLVKLQPTQFLATHLMARTGNPSFVAGVNLLVLKTFQRGMFCWYLF